MRLSNFGAVRLPLLAAAVLASFAASLSAQVVEKGRTYADLVATHPCNSGSSGRLARVTDAQSSSSIGGGGGSTQVWAVCDGVSTWTLTSIGSAGGGAATAVTGSATLPATCTEKDLYQDTDSGGTEFYVCTATNTWTKAGTIGGTLGATDNYGTCADGTGAATAQPCTDQALFPGGASEAAPGIAFQNDPNTGLIAPGSDVLALVTGGASRLLFDGSTMQVKNTILATFRGIQISGSIDPVLAISGSVASPLVLHDGYSQYLLTNEGATAMRAVTLPDAVAGYTLKFCNQDSDGIRINANAGDTIRRVASVTSSGGYIETTTIGACIVIKAINATENYVVDSNDLATDSWSFN